MDTTLASLTHAATYLPDRTRVDDVADVLFTHLRTATRMIATYTGLDFTSDARVVLFDTPRTQAPTPGASAPPFTRSGDEPSFSLVLPGEANSLVLRYRGGYTFDRDFDWTAVEPLVENEDYIYQRASGRIRLLFSTDQLIDGLRAEFSTGYATQPEILMGSRRVELFSRMGLETALSPLVNMFVGVDQKMLADCASAPGAQPELASLIIQPPGPYGLHALHVYTARDGAIVADDQPVTLALTRQETNGAYVPVMDYSVPNALPGQVYTLRGNPVQANTRYKLTLTGTTDTTVNVSTIAIDFADPDRENMQASAPATLTEACAMLAVYLMGVNVNDGTGKDADNTNRAYSGHGIPKDIKAMLSGYRSTRVSFI